MILSQIAYGLLATVIGVLLLKYNYQVVGLTGRQDWIEDVLGSGTTYLAYKLFALIIIIGGILYGTGLGTPFFTWFFSPLASLFPRS